MAYRAGGFPILALRRTVTLANLDFAKLAVAVPPAVYDEWRERYGTDGTPSTRQLEPCATCEVWPSTVGAQQAENAADAHRRLASIFVLA